MPIESHVAMLGSPILPLGNLVADGQCITEEGHIVDEEERGSPGDQPVVFHHRTAVDPDSLSTEEVVGGSGVESAEEEEDEGHDES